MTPKIVVLEGDRFRTEELLLPAINEYGNISVIPHESTFLGYLETAARNNTWPDLFILNEIARWQPPFGQTPMTKEAQEQGIYEAGLRCYNAIRHTYKNNTTPVIFHGYAEPSDVIQILSQKDAIKLEEIHFAPIREQTQLLKSTIESLVHRAA